MLHGYVAATDPPACPSCDIRITENDLKNRGYEEFLTAAGTTVKVDPDTGEIL